MNNRSDAKKIADRDEIANASSVKEAGCNDAADREKIANASSTMEAGYDDYEEKSMPNLSAAFHDKYEEMVLEDIPDLWARIEVSLPEKHVETTSSNVVVMHSVNSDAQTQNMQTTKTGNSDAQVANAKPVNVQKTKNAKIRMWSGILAACACVAICIPAIIFAQKNGLFRNQTISNSESLVADEAVDKGTEEDGTQNNFFQSLHGEDAGSTVDFAPAEDMSGAEIMEEAACEAAESENGTGIADDMTEESNSVPCDDITEECDDATYDDMTEGDADVVPDYIYYDGNQILDKADYTVEELHYENDVLISMVVRGEQNRRYVIIPTEGRLVIEQDDGVRTIGYVNLPEDFAEGDVLTMKLYDATALTGSFFLFKLY